MNSNLSDNFALRLLRLRFRDAMLRGQGPRMAKLCSQYDWCLGVPRWRDSPCDIHRRYPTYRPEKRKGRRWAKPSTRVSRRILQKIA